MSKFLRFTGILVLMVTMTIGTMKAQKLDTLWLNQIDLSKVAQEYGSARANLSLDRHPLTVSGQVFKKGLGTHAAGLIEMDLKGTADSFQGFVGIDDEVKGSEGGSVRFVLLADKIEVFRSPLMKQGMTAVKVDINLKGVKKLSLVVEDGGDGNDYDHADWLNTFIVFNGVKPEAIGAPAVKP